MKIIATVNKNPYNHKTTGDVIRAGADYLRFNFSHNNPSFNIGLMKDARKLVQKFNIKCKLIADIPGRKVRLAPYFKSISRDKAYIYFDKDKDYEFIAGKFNTYDKTKTVINIDDLSKILRVKEIITLGDGDIGFLVKRKVSGNKYICRALRTERVAYMSSINSSRTVKICAQIPENIDEIFSAIKIFRPDMITQSFARSKKQVLKFKQKMKEFGIDDIPLIAKIESADGVKNIDEILEVTDGAMVARGDLALMTDFALIGIYEKKIIKACRHKKKFSIVSTQIIESILTKYVPQRSEIIDLTTAIEYGADAIMLCRESAHTDDPRPNVALVKDIIKRIEKGLKQLNTLKR